MTTTSVSPLVLQPSFRWAGNDGNWSTFQVNIGTPPQSFDFLPSTCNGEIWVPLPDSCPSTYSDCASSRGLLSESSPTDQGFQADQSTTWVQTGIYGLLLEEGLFHSNDSGLYGLDSVSVGDENAWLLREQTVAAIATPKFWLGSLGLSVQPSDSSVENEPHLPMLSALKVKNVTASESYGLSVGAAYRGAAGGFVLGGYDADAFEQNSVQFNLRFNGSRSLTASLQSLVVTNTLEGQQAMPISVPEGLNMSIDSTVSQIWLPRNVYDRLESLLGLQYDTSRELYLVNVTTRAQLLDLSPSFTFTLAANSSTSNRTTSVTLPYAAFDQQIGEPYYSRSMAYFPIGRAQDPTQLVLGRTFLQEAYVIVDWERGNFSLAQTTHQTRVSKKIVAILPPLADHPSEGSGTAAKAGIAVGAVAAAVMVAVSAWLFWWRRWRSRSNASTPGPLQEYFLPEKDGYPATSSQTVLELASKDRKLVEPMSGERHELHEDQIRHQLMSSDLHELPGHYIGSEMSAHDRERGS